MYVLCVVYLPGKREYTEQNYTIVYAADLM